MWLPEPEPGETVCGGFDGSENSDHTAIKLETRAGYLFTPRWGPDKKPTIWNPAEHDGRIPRHEIRFAWSEIVKRYDLRRAYCDPGFHDETSWETEIEAWANEWGGEDQFVSWPTTSIQRMYPAVRRFESDLKTLITHDGCPITIGQMRNARKISKGADRYTLGKPAQHQKIDAAVTSVLAHEAASDERAAGWPDPVDTRIICFS